MDEVENKDNKLLYFIGIVVLALIVVSVLFFDGFKGSNVIYRIDGRIVEVKENSIVVETTGIYNLHDYSSIDLENYKEIELAFDSNTIFDKLLISATQEQIDNSVATGENFTPEEGRFDGSVSDLNTGMNVQIESDNYLSSSANIIRIEYSISDFPLPTEFLFSILKIFSDTEQMARYSVYGLITEISDNSISIETAGVYDSLDPENILQGRKVINEFNFDSSTVINKIEVSATQEEVDKSFEEKVQLHPKEEFLPGNTSDFSVGMSVEVQVDNYPLQNNKANAVQLTYNLVNIPLPTNFKPR